MPLSAEAGRIRPGFRPDPSWSGEFLRHRGCRPRPTTRSHQCGGLGAGPVTLHESVPRATASTATVLPPEGIFERAHHRRIHHGSTVHCDLVCAGIQYALSVLYGLDASPVSGISSTFRMARMVSSVAPRSSRVADTSSITNSSAPSEA